MPKVNTLSKYVFNRSKILVLCDFDCDFNCIHPFIVRRQSNFYQNNLMANENKMKSTTSLYLQK